MVSPYPFIHKKSPATSNDGVKFTEWLIIVAFLITMTVGYAYYRIYKNEHRPAPDQPVATSSVNSTAANDNGPAQPNP